MSLHLTPAEAEALLAEVDAGAARAACTATHTQCVARAAMRHGVSGAHAEAWAAARGMARGRVYETDAREHAARYDSAARTALVLVLAAREHAYRTARN